MGALPLNNSQKLNQDLYREAEQMGYQVDTSNHSRGGLTASIALQDMNIWKGETNIPIRKSRFYAQQLMCKPTLINCNATDIAIEVKMEKHIRVVLIQQYIKQIL